MHSLKCPPKGRVPLLIRITIEVQHTTNPTLHYPFAFFLKEIIHPLALLWNILYDERLYCFPNIYEMNKWLHFSFNRCFLRAAFARCMLQTRATVVKKTDMVPGGRYCIKSALLFNYNCEKSYKREVQRAKRTNNSHNKSHGAQNSTRHSMCISSFKPRSKVPVLFPLCRAGN